MVNNNTDLHIANQQWKLDLNGFIPYSTKCNNSDDQQKKKNLSEARLYSDFSCWPPKSHSQRAYTANACECLQTNSDRICNSKWEARKTM